MTIAGHVFVNGRCACGRIWLDIRNTTREDIGLSHIAHIGQLTDMEYTQIEEQRREEDDRFQNAMAVVSGA